MMAFDRLVCDYPLPDSLDQDREFLTRDFGGLGLDRRNHPSIREMEGIAWVLRTDSNRKHIGFVRSRDLEPADRFVLPDDEYC